MKTEGFFTIHKYEVEVNSWTGTYYLIPVGDIHYGANNFHEEKFDQFIDWAKDRRDCFYLFTGDMIDFMSTSERNALNISNYHESTINDIEELADQKVNKLCEKVKFMKGNIIGALGGNHYFQYYSGITSTDKFCEQMKCKNLGVASFIRFVIREKVKGRKSKPITSKLDIYVHHGRGAGRTAGASVNKLEYDMQGKVADIYCQGHDHKKFAVTKSQIGLSSGGGNLALVQKKILLLRTGGFLRGYVDGKKSYLAEADYNPTDLGVVKVMLCLKRNKVGSRYIDIHASI